MITITENRTTIMQMKDDFKIAEVKKADVVDFGTDMTNGDLRIVFKAKGDDVIMHFSVLEQFNNAVAELIVITDGMQI